MWPVAALARRRYGHRFALEGREAWAYRGVRLAALAVLLPLGGYLQLVLTLMGDLYLLSANLDPVLRILQVASLTAFPAGAVIGLWNLALVWGRPRGAFARLWSAVLAGSVLALLAIAVGFHLLSFDLRF